MTPIFVFLLGACATEPAIVQCATPTPVEADTVSALGFSPRQLAAAHAAWRGVAAVEGDAPGSAQLAAEGPFEVTVTYDEGGEAQLLEPTGTCSGVTAAVLSAPVIVTLTAASGDLLYTAPHRIDGADLTRGGAVWARADGEASSSEWPAWAETLTLPQCAGDGDRRLDLALAESCDAPRLVLTALSTDPEAGCDAVSTLASVRLAVEVD